MLVLQCERGFEVYSFDHD